MKLRRNTKSNVVKKHKKKASYDNVLLTILERKTRYALVLAIAAKTSIAVTEGIDKIRSLFDKQFADLSSLESKTATKLYFTHPYSSFEKGTNDRHNGLIRRFIPKGNRISDYTSEEIAFIEEWMNTLPRKILKYKTPEELFELHLDQIYAL